MTSEGGVAGEAAKPSFCAGCGKELAPGSNFCTSCGRQVAPARPLPPPFRYDPYPEYRMLTLRDVARVAGSYSSLALFVLMAVNVAIALWAIGLVYPVMDGATASLYIITPFIVHLFSFSGVPFLIYYILLATAILASFVWALIRSVRPLDSELRGKMPSSGHSPIYMVGTLFMAVMAFNIIFYFVVEGTGSNPTTPGFQTYDLWELIFAFAQASVWEEVVSRMLLIGVPLLIIDYAVARTPESGPRRGALNYLLGGGFTIGRREAVFLALSSAMFGLAHVFAWDPFKVIPSAMAGLAFGYLFLKVGIYASILLHFAFDFLSIPLELFPSNEGVILAIGLTLIVWIVVGIPYMLLYASKGLGWLLGRPLWPEKALIKRRPAYAAGSYQQPAYYPPAPYQGGQYAPPPMAPPSTYGRPRDPTAIGFTCRNCGHREALYRDGELTCTRCGTKN